MTIIRTENPFPNVPLPAGARPIALAALEFSVTRGLRLHRTPFAGDRSAKRQRRRWADAG
jgi:hypothetical protein